MQQVERKIYYVIYICTCKKVKLGKLKLTTKIFVITVQETFLLSNLVEILNLHIKIIFLEMRHGQ
jgi:hypothetical protein